jgi:hypothetical protein
MKVFFTGKADSGMPAPLKATKNEEAVVMAM